MKIRISCILLYSSGRTQLSTQVSHFSVIVTSARKTIRSFWFSFQTILLGDSGVGKTSLLVQFDTGKFQSGSFAATVGIGFTVSCNERKMNASAGFPVLH